MRATRESWVVDAYDGTDGDFAKRAFAAPRLPKPSGRRPAYNFELCQPLAAADLMWTGSLPDGCSRTMPRNA